MPLAELLLLRPLRLLTTTMAVQELHRPLLPLRPTTMAPLPGLLLPRPLRLLTTTMAVQELPQPIPDPVLSLVTPIPAKHPLPIPTDPLRTQGLPLPPVLPRITALQDPLEQAITPTAALRDLLATATTLTIAEATPDLLTIHLTAQIAPTAEATATHTPDRQTTTQAVLPIVTQDPRTVLPTAQAAEAVATHTPDLPVAQAVLRAAIQDLPAVQAAIQEAVAPQEAPSPAVVQEAMPLQEEDKF